MEFLADENGILVEEAYRSLPSTDGFEAAQAKKTVGRAKAAERYSTFSLPTAAAPTKTREQLATGRTRAKPAANVRDGRQASSLTLSRDFVCSPSAVVVNDFKVGTTYTIELTFTNVSKGFATFRVLPVPPQIRDCVSVAYTFPSRIPAGLSWPVSVTFTPTKNEDVRETLQLRSESGLFSIPLVASAQKTDIAVVTKEVNFGVLAIGETRTRNIVLRNSGALGGTVTLGGSFRDLQKEVHTNPITQMAQPYFKVDPSEGAVYVHPHSEKTISVVFSPFEECDVDCFMTIAEKMAPPLANVRIVARSTGLPVYAAEPEIDFLWCFYGKTYWHPVQIVNTSSVSSHVRARIPAELQSIVCVEPETMTIQPGSSYQVTLHFSPVEGLSQSFASLIEFQVKGQALPPSVAIRASLTTPNFHPESTQLDFGSFYMNEELLSSLRVTNACMVPQKVWAASVPSTVTVSPESATLIPGEVFTFSVSLVGDSPGIISTSVVLCGEHGGSHVVKIVGAAMMPSLSLSESSIKLPSCPADGQVWASAVLSNTSPQTREFEFHSPTTFLKISPSTGVLKPGESLAFAVLLSPQFNVQAQRTVVTTPAEIPRLTKIKKSSTKASIFCDEEIESMRLMEENARKPDFTGWNEHALDGTKSWHRDDVIECVSHTGGSGATGSVERLRLTVRSVVVVVPRVVLRVTTGSSVAAPDEEGPNKDTPAVSVQRGKALRSKKDTVSDNVESPNVVAVSEYATTIHADFGDVGVGATVSKVLFVCNKGNTSTTVSILPPLRVGSFFVPRPPRDTLLPNEEDGFVVHFTPNESGSFEETLKVVVDSGTLVAHFTGRCSETDVTFHLGGVEDASVGKEEDVVQEICFPPTLVNNICEHAACLTNTGPFPVVASVVLAKEDSGTRLPYYSAPPFLCQPSDFEVAARSKQAMCFSFHPRSEGSYITRAQINAGKLTQSITLSGLATAHSAYVVPPGRRNVYDFVDAERATPHEPPCVGLSPDYPIQLRFLWEESKTFSVGSVRGGPAFECAVGDWKESYNSAGWEKSTAKLSIAAGNEAQFTVSLRSTGRDAHEMVPYCRFTLAIRCASDPANDRVLHVSCTGP